MFIDSTSAPLTVKFVGGKQGMFDGYASTFGGPPDAYGDVVSPGAFTRSLMEHRAAGTAPAMLWAHDMAEPIGRWMDVREDPAGLKVMGALTMDLQRAQDAYALARDGALGLSIGFRTVQSERTAGGGRLLKQLQLAEISLVAIPANASARITSLKSAAPHPHQITNPRAFEHFLRDAGFSRAFAKACTASGFKAAAGLRDADGADDELAREIRAASALFRSFTKG